MAILKKFLNSRKSTIDFINESVLDKIEQDILSQYKVKSHKEILIQLINTKTDLNRNRDLVYATLHFEVKTPFNKSYERVGFTKKDVALSCDEVKIKYIHGNYEVHLYYYNDNPLTKELVSVVNKEKKV